VDRAVIVGLGNPGSEYDETRHNVGFRVVDELCRRTRTRLKPGKGGYLAAESSVAGHPVVLVKPLTYMNNSGEAVVEALEQYGGRPDNLVVVVDDFVLPLGALRIRPKGSDGGHNGLRSIIYHLNTDEFTRIRCGIRKEMMPAGNAMADFVLSSFDPDETEAVAGMIVRAADAATGIVVADVARAMNKFNT
jgi:PTH1 family peptidyl-tRNA hydrolase